VDGAGPMHRLFQSLCERIGFSRAETSGRDASHTVRTEVTVERKETTVLVGGVTSGAFDSCPLCGQELAPAPAAQGRARLEGRPGSQTAPSG
jgi:hypothetical protein